MPACSANSTPIRRSRPTRYPRTTIPLLALISLAACSSPTSKGEGELTAEARAPYVVLANTGSRTVHRTMHPAGGISEIAWRFDCTRPTCGAIEPGARDSLHYHVLPVNELVPDSVAVYGWYFDGDDEPADGIARVNVPL